MHCGGGKFKLISVRSGFTDQIFTGAFSGVNSTGALRQRIKKRNWIELWFRFCGKQNLSLKSFKIKQLYERYCRWYFECNQNNKRTFVNAYSPHDVRAIAPEENCLPDNFPPDNCSLDVYPLDYFPPDNWPQG